MPEATVREKLKKMCASGGCGEIADVAVLPADPAAGLRSATITFADAKDVKKGLKALNQRRSPMGTGALRARPNNHATVTLDFEMCVWRRRWGPLRGLTWLASLTVCAVAIRLRVLACLAGTNT